MLKFDRTSLASSTEPAQLQMLRRPHRYSRTLVFRATYSAPMLLSAAVCRWNVGQLRSPPYAATAWRRSVSIIDEPELGAIFRACNQLFGVNL
jgi:hypothetical protein